MMQDLCIAVVFDWELERPLYSLGPSGGGNPKELVKNKDTVQLDTCNSARDSGPSGANKMGGSETAPQLFRLFSGGQVLIRVSGLCLWNPEGWETHRGNMAEGTTLK